MLSVLGRSGHRVTADSHTSDVTGYKQIDRNLCLYIFLSLFKLFSNHAISPLARRCTETFILLSIIRWHRHSQDCYFNYIFPFIMKRLFIKLNRNTSDGSPAP